jgi:hypothetical protein
MIRHRLFSKGETVYALLSNFRYPNVLFPVQAVIYDVKFDTDMPQYQLKISKFYDDVAFLKRYFFGLTFKRDFDAKQTKINLKRSLYPTIQDLERVFTEKWESYMIAVDSVYCVKTQGELKELFNSLQDHFVEKNIKDLWDLTSRSFYSKGQYYYHARGEFEASLKKFLADRVKPEKDYFDKLLYRADNKELDNIE